MWVKMGGKSGASEQHGGRAGSKCDFGANRADLGQNQAGIWCRMELKSPACRAREEAERRDKGAEPIRRKKGRK